MGAPGLGKPPGRGAAQLRGQRRIPRRLREGIHRSRRRRQIRIARPEIDHIDSRGKEFPLPGRYVRQGVGRQLAES